MRIVGPNGTYKDNRTLGREYAGQVEVETALQECRLPPRNKIPTSGLTQNQWNVAWNRTFQAESGCRARRR